MSKKSEFITRKNSKCVFMNVSFCGMLSHFKGNEKEKIIQLLAACLSDFF